MVDCKNEINLTKLRATDMAHNKIIYPPKLKNKSTEMKIQIQRETAVDTMKKYTNKIKNNDKKKNNNINLTKEDIWEGKK